jgi:hypothetical protein
MVTALFSDEDCLKDLIIDTFGADPTLVSFLAAGTNLFMTTFLWHHHKDEPLRSSYQSQQCQPSSFLLMSLSFARSSAKNFVRTLFDSRFSSQACRRTLTTRFFCRSCIGQYYKLLSQPRIYNVHFYVC